MTKKDYELIASNIKECTDICLANPLPLRTKAGVLGEMARHLAYALQEENPRFDPNRFLKACGVAV